MLGLENREKLHARKISYIIRNQLEPRHRSAVLAIKCDNEHDILYTGGRDSIIRVWNTRQCFEGNRKAQYVSSLEGHLSCVSDLAVCCKGELLASSSFDKTIKLWKSDSTSCFQTLHAHQDHVTALAYAKNRELIASASLDKMIHLWDLNKPIKSFFSIQGSKHSIYSLAMNDTASVIASGSPETFLRLYDPRVRTRIMKLRGHTDNIRSIVISNDGRKLLSGCSDGTIMLWDLRKRMYVETIYAHTLGVWSLLASEEFHYVVSGSRDRCIFLTNLRNVEEKIWVAQEQEGIISMDFNDEKSGIWVSTWKSDVRCWQMPNIELSWRENGREVSCIEGDAGIRKFAVLNDQRFIITKDSLDNVAMYDVIYATKVTDLGKGNFEQQIKFFNKNVYTPKWFSVDIKTGMLMITLDSISVRTWVTIPNGFLSFGYENNYDKQVDCVNYCALLLQALFQYWQPPITVIFFDGIFDDKQPGNGYYSLPRHTPIIIWGDTRGWHLRIRDTNYKSNSMLLLQILPKWVKDIVIHKIPPPSELISICAKHYFELSMSSSSSSSESSFSSNSKSEVELPLLCINGALPFGKVCKYILKKLLEVGQIVRFDGDGIGDADTIRNIKTNDFPTIDCIEVFCKDILVDLAMDVRSVRRFIWKESTDMIVKYKFKSGFRFNANKSEGTTATSTDSYISVFDSSRSSQTEVMQKKYYQN